MNVDWDYRQQDLGRYKVRGLSIQLKRPVSGAATHFKGAEGAKLEGMAGPGPQGGSEEPSASKAGDLPRKACRPQHPYSAADETGSKRGPQGPQHCQGQELAPP